MTFKEVLRQVVEWLQEDGRVSYCSVKRQFDLDDNYFEDLQEALRYTHAEVVDDDGRGFVWTGEPPAPLPNSRSDTDCEIRFQAILPTVIGLIQGKKRVTYRTLQYAFGFDEALLAEIKEELLLVGVARDEDGKVLVWTGESPSINPPAQPIPSARETAETRTLSNGPTALSEPLLTDISPEASTVTPDVRSSLGV